MADIDYGSIATEIGLVKLTNAALLNTSINITQIKLGDSNSVEYTPDGSETDLKNVVYTGLPNSIVANPDNEIQASLELVVPSDSDSFYVREMGAYDEDGDLIYISAIAPRFKPQTDQQSVDMSFELMVAMLNATSLEVVIDTSKAIATQSYVDNKEVSVSSPLLGGGDLSGGLTLTIQDGTTEQKGAVQLVDSVESESTTLAATGSAVKAAYDKVPIYITEQAFSSGIYSSGYRIWSDGLIEQWGIADGGASQVINLPVAYTTEQIYNSATLRTSGITDKALSTDVGSTTQFTVLGTTSTVTTFAWASKGY